MLKAEVDWEEKELLKARNRDYPHIRRAPGSLLNNRMFSTTNFSCVWVYLANELNQKDYKLCLLKRETGSTRQTTEGARFTSKQQDV